MDFETLFKKNTQPNVALANQENFDEFSVYNQNSYIKNVQEVCGGVWKKQKNSI